MANFYDGYYATASLTNNFTGARVNFNPTNNYSNGVTVNLADSHLVINTGGLYRISCGLQLQRNNPYNSVVTDTSGWVFAKNGFIFTGTTYPNNAITTMTVQPGGVNYTFVSFETIVGLAINDYIDLHQNIGSGAVINWGYLSVIGMF
jgi:hypothetical protein